MVQPVDLLADRRGTKPDQVSPCKGFEVLAEVFMKSCIFWDTSPCSPLKASRRFGGARRVHLRGRRISQRRKHPEVDSCLAILRP
jgi:hypothetical protein